MELVKNTYNSEKLVSQLPIEGNGLEWLENAIITKGGRLSSKNFSVNNFLGMTNIVRVINKLGRDYLDELKEVRAKYSQALALVDASDEDTEFIAEDGNSYIRHCEAMIGRLESSVDNVADFVWAYYRNEGDFIWGDELETTAGGLGLLGRMTLKPMFASYLNEFREKYADEILAAYNHQAEKAGEFEYITGYDAMGYIDNNN